MGWLSNREARRLGNRAAAIFYGALAGGWPAVVGQGWVYDIYRR